MMAGTQFELVRVYVVSASIFVHLSAGKGGKKGKLARLPWKRVCKSEDSMTARASLILGSKGLMHRCNLVSFSYVGM